MASLLKNRHSSILLILAGVAVGVVLALIVWDGESTATSQADVCHGYGDLIGTSSWLVTDEGVRGVERGGLGIDVTRGERRELRECRISEFQTVTLDAQTGVVLDRFTDIGAALARATEQPRRTPEAIKAFERAMQASFVEPADVPADLTAGCDPAWVRTTFQQVGAVVCHPADWTVRVDNSLEGIVAGDQVEVGILGVRTESHTTKCLTPAFAETAAGTAAFCALGPSPYVRVNYGVALSNGRNLGINIFKEAGVEEELLALRVAVNIRGLP